MAFVLEAACGSFIGTARNENEDNFYFNNLFLPDENEEFNGVISCTLDTDKMQTFALFDGMGGELLGREAALTATTVFAECVRNKEKNKLDNKHFFADFCSKADDRICELAYESCVNTCGTTFAGIIYEGENVICYNIGDSKIFRIYENKISQISAEHTDKEILEKMGIEKKPVLLQYLGIKKHNVKIEPYFVKGTIKSNSYFVICSDGITDVIPPSSIYKYIKKYENSQLAVQAVLQEAKHLNALDNSTIIIIKAI